MLWGKRLSGLLSGGLANSGRLANRMAAYQSKLLVLVGAMLLVMLLGGLMPSLHNTIEERLGGLGWTLFSLQEPEERITIVAIDERSLSEIGPWPWHRSVLAELSDRLRESGAALQLFDVVLPEMKEGDDALLASLNNTRGVLAQIPILPQSATGLSSQSAGGAVRSGVMGSAIKGLGCREPVPEATGYLASHRDFAVVPKGHITPIVDGDGSIRKQPPLICVDGLVYPSLSLQALLQGFAVDGVRSSESVSIKPGQGWLAPSWSVQLGDYLGVKVPIDNDGNVRISYHQNPSVFRFVSAADVLAAPSDSPLLASLVENKWVLIGATAFGLGDVVPTPYSGMAPGVELQARLLVSMLDGSVPFTPKGASLLLVLEGLVFALVLLWLSSLTGRGVTVGLPLAVVVMPVLALLLHVQLLQANVWLGWLSPGLFGAVAAAMLSLLEHRRVRVERRRVYSNLSSYLPADVAKDIAFNLPTNTIVASRRELVIMCADLRNFSSYEALHSPEESAALLHCFFMRAAEVIAEHNGAVEEFTGDSVLASWSIAPEGNGALQALEAANAMQRVMSAIMPTPIALGISIEKGPVLVGSIGPAERRTHTLLGDTVTLALRIQDMTAELAQPILLGESAARALKGEGLVSQGAYLLDGMRTPHTIFAPGHIEPADELTVEDDYSVVHNGLPLKVISGGKD